MQTQLPLKRKFTFWLNPSKLTKLDRDNYEDQLKCIGTNHSFFISHFNILGTISTIQEFWTYYLHIVRPEYMPEGTQIFLFQSQIKPFWEDPFNKNGGRFLFRVKKNYANRIWEELLISLIGEQCILNDFVCGVCAHSKKSFVQIGVWITEMSSSCENYKRIQQWIIDTIQMKDNQELEFMNHPQ